MILNNGLIKKLFRVQNQIKSDYWDILSITTNLFYYYLFRTDETINYKKFCLCSEKIPYIIIILILIITPDEFLNISENRRDYKYKEYLNTLTFKKLYNNVREKFYIFSYDVI